MPENNITAHYDQVASNYIQRAAENAEQADKATTIEARQRYWVLMLEYFAKAGNALDIAKGASGKSK